LVRSSTDNDEEIDAANDRSGLIESLARDISDPIEICNLVTGLFIAGQNMTGTMAAWYDKYVPRIIETLTDLSRLFAQLEHNFEIFNRVREGVMKKFGTEVEPKAPLTWDNMEPCETMHSCLLETMRMYPLLPNIGRSAKCDIVLPRGGGPDGLQPIAVPREVFCHL